MAKLYPGIAFSPQTTLADNLGEADTIIKVADVSVFPDAPNYATIGTDEDGETILYAAKAEGILSGCQRGVEGTARAWRSGEIIGRNFTAKDHNDLIDTVAAAQNTADAATTTATAAQTAAATAQETADKAVSDAAVAQETADANTAAIATKQDKLAGTSYQIVGFDADGNAIAANRWGNPNLLDNWYFADPINQRGQTEYTGTNYCIDKWRISNDNTKIKVIPNDCIRLYVVNHTSNGRAIQYGFENSEPFYDKTVTFSCLFKNLKSIEGFYIALFSAHNCFGTNLEIVKSGKIYESEGYGIISCAVHIPKKESLGSYTNICPFIGFGNNKEQLTTNTVDLIAANTKCVNANILQNRSR